MIYDLLSCTSFQPINKVRRASTGQRKVDITVDGKINVTTLGEHLTLCFWRTLLFSCIFITLQKSKNTYNQKFYHHTLIKIIYL